MPSINGQFVLPGVFSVFQPTAVLPTAPGGVRVAALIGSGRTTNLVVGESVTRGSGNNDALANFATAFDGSTVTDEDLNTYLSGVDYSATPVSGGMAWLTGAVTLTGTVAQPYNGLVGASIILTVGGGSPQTYTFVSGDFVVPTAATAAEVATAINANITGITASGSTPTANHVNITTNATTNSSLLIGSGTSNAILGFTAGSFVQTPRRPAMGKKYTVNYEYAKATADYSPVFYFSLDQVTQAYGDIGASDVNGLYQLPIGASLVFQNGASVLCAVQMNPADGPAAQQVRVALNKLLAVAGINIVVSLDAADNALLLPDIKTHVDTASSITNKNERTAIVGVDPSSSYSSMLSYASGVADKRIVLVNAANASYSVTLGNNANPTLLNGAYTAAALAGVRTNPSFDVAQPMTRQTFSGFASVTNTLTQAQKTILANSGVLVIDIIGGVPRVVFGTTTDVSLIENQLFNVVEAIDYVATTVRQLLDAIFIGQKLLADTPSQVASTTAAILTSLQNSNIIVSFTTPSATVDVIPTQIDLSFGIRPVFEVDTILIKFGLNLNG